MQPRSFTRDLLDTFVTSVATVFSLVVTVRLLAEGLGPDGFGAYSLARRIISTLDPFLTMTMGIAVTRFVAVTQDDRLRRNYLLAGMVLGVVPSIALLSTGFVLHADLTAIIFRSHMYDTLLLTTLFLMVGYCCFIVLYAFYRGRGEMRKANLWQLAVIAIGPLVVASLYYRSNDVALIVGLNGVLCFAAVVPLLLLGFKNPPRTGRVQSFGRCVVELFKYGFPRLPGGLAFPGILAMGPFIAPYVGALSHAGYLLAGQSLLRVIEGGTEAFSRASLPRWAQLSTTAQHEALRHRVSVVFGLAFHVGIFSTAHLILWSDQIVLLLLGSRYSDATPVLRILMLAVYPYLTYSLLRPIIDAVDARAINSSNACMAFVVGAALSIGFSSLGMSVVGLAAATSIAFVILGFLTALHIWRTYGLDASGLGVKRAFALNCGILLAAWLLRKALLSFELGLLGSVLSISGLELLLFFLYCVALRQGGASWVLELEFRIRTWRELQPQRP